MGQTSTRVIWIQILTYLLTYIHTRGKSPTAPLNRTHEYHHHCSRSTLSLLSLTILFNDKSPSTLNPQPPSLYPPSFPPSLPTCIHTRVIPVPSIQYPLFVPPWMCIPPRLHTYPPTTDSRCPTSCRMATCMYPHTRWAARHACIRVLDHATG